MIMESEQDPPTHRRWITLDQCQRALAQELTDLAEQIRERSEDGLGWAESVALAAAQLGLDDRTGR
jgi:phage gp36-like protein